MSTGVLYQTRKKIKKVKLNVTHDMGWQKRSSGGRYDSYNGNEFIIVGRSNGIIGMVLYYKAFQKCDDVKKRKE